MTTPRDTPASRRVRANGDGTVYQRKDSRWEAAGYVLAPGNTRRRVRVYGASRKEALAKLTEKIAASNRGVPLPSAQGSVAAYLTYWLENVAIHHLRENTHTRYTTCVHRYLIPGLGKKKLTKLTAKDVRTWLTQLRTTCQCCSRGIDARRDQPLCCAVGQCCHRLLSPLTLTYLHSVLKSALEHAVREEEIPRNVARNVRTSTPRPRRFEPLTADEARELLTATQGHRLHALFELALHTGLRKGELLGLRWEDLDLDAGTAAIHRTLQRTVTGGLTTLPTKTRASERRIAIPDRCVQSLERHHEQQQREREAAGNAWQPNRHVFTTAQGGPLDPTNLTRAFTRLLRTAGLRRIRFHDLRHSTATLLLEQGVELVVIKEILGHSHIGVTATVYAHVRLRLQRDAIDALGTALSSPETTATASGDGDDPPAVAALVH
ncbi:tyrosine-type recombinase/integrase [Streptomyces sp. NPDC048445]|uniref:tyrosine-type recombinase/integrase n=1 Tax=Streptomyces sp. NPDC048445 TaxID=3365553 RepID=UPI003715764E